MGKRLYGLNESFFGNIGTEEQAYWLGFVAADGGVLDTPRNRCLVVNLAPCDKGHLEKLAAALGSTRPLQALKPRPGSNSPRGWQAAFHSPLLVAGLRAHCVHPRKSLNGEPWAGPAELMRHYWRGAFDGDGCISRAVIGHKTPQWSLSFCGSKGMVEAFAVFASAHNGSRARVHPTATIWQVLYGGIRAAQATAGLLYRDASVALKRKALLAQELLTLRPKTYPRGNLTRHKLVSLRLSLGSWTAVARSLGITLSCLGVYRRRAGIPPYIFPGHDAALMGLCPPRPPSGNIGAWPDGATPPSPKT
jgi:hypothetical protein